MDEPRCVPRTCEDPGKAVAEGGMVILDGPDGVAVTMTVDAAESTADSLREAARLARRMGSDSAQDDELP